MTNKKILIIEDNLTDALLLSIYLNKLGFNNENIIHCSNGKDGIEIYKKLHNNISCILLDTNLPYMSGYTILHEILTINQNSIVIMETADINQKPDKYKAYLLKPFTIHQLKQTLINLNILS